MERILSFNDFLLEKIETPGYELNESLPASSGQNVESAINIIKNYIDKTNNKGGDSVLAEKTADSVIKETPGDSFYPFFRGVTSICVMDIFKKVFGKIGLIGNMDPSIIDEIIKSSQFLLNDKFPEMINSWEGSNGFKGVLEFLGSTGNKVINELISSNLVLRMKENVKNADIILEELNIIKHITEALKKDSIEELSESELQFLAEIFSDAISDYQTANKIKSSYPKFYSQCSDLIGGDDADLSAGLGSLGL